VTQGIPVLKYPGPQPVLLNRILKSKTQWGIKMYQKHEELEQGAHLAECEDEWDMILQKTHGVTDTDAAGREGWAKTFIEVDRGLERQVMARGKKYAALGKRLWEIVLAEREMKEKERKEAKRQRRMARKSAAGEAVTMSMTGAEEDSTKPTPSSKDVLDDGNRTAAS